MEYFDKLFHISGTRCCGKTTSAIINAEYYGYKVIVTQCPPYCSMKAKEMNINNLKFISYTDFINNGCDEPFVIDEIDNFMLFMNKNYKGHTNTTR